MAVMLSNFAHGLMVAGIVLLNYLIYGIVLHGTGLLATFVLYAYTSIKEETLSIIIRLIILASFILVALMMVLYALGTFRLIPIP